MPKVQIISRDRAVHYPGEPPEAHLVAVTYSSLLIPPRTLGLPPQRYRAASPAELAAQPRLKLYPVDQAALDQELKAIGEDLAKSQLAAPPTYEVP